MVNKKNELILISIKETDYEKPKKRNKYIPDKKYEKIDKTCEKNAVITERGEVLVNSKATKNLLGVQSKGDAEYIFINQIPEKDKIEIEKEQYAISSAFVGLLDEKAQTARNAEKADILRYGRDSLINIADSDKSEAIRRQFDAHVEKELPKLKDKRNVSNDEITGEPLKKGAAFHHDDKKSLITNLNNLLDPEKGIVVNPETHKVIHELEIKTQEEREKRTPEILEELEKKSLKNKK